MVLSALLAEDTAGLLSQQSRPSRLFLTSDAIFLLPASHFLLLCVSQGLTPPERTCLLVVTLSLASLLDNLPGLLGSP